MAKKKVKKIKSKVKIIREIKEGEEPIDEMTSSDMGFSESEMDNVTDVHSASGLSGQVENVSVPHNFGGGPEEVREVEDTGPLYEIGRALGGAAPVADEKSYVATEMRASGMPEARVGQGMSQGTSLLPEDQIVEQTEAKMREKKKDYAGERVDEGGREERQRYPWERRR